MLEPSGPNFAPHPKHLLVDLSDANTAVLLINCLTIDNRNFLVDCRNCSQFIIESEINVFLLQDAVVQHGSGLSLGHRFGNTCLKK